MTVQTDGVQPENTVAVDVERRIGRRHAFEKTEQQRTARNIQGVATATVGTLNTYDVLKYDALILTKDAVEKVEEVYA